jgi:hypothetical protein
MSQRELAALAGISQQSVSLIERGHLDTLAIRAVRRTFGVVEARAGVALSWRGGALDRLLDARHAALVELVVRELRGHGWEVAVEASFNHYGDRGSIDVLALHPETAAALVVEVKSELAAIEETVRRLDVEVRLAPAIVEQRFRIRPAVVGRLVVLPRSTTAWRRVRSVAATLDAALPDRGGACRRWLRAPAGPMAGVLFVSPTNGRGGKCGPS